MDAFGISVSINAVIYHTSNNRGVTQQTIAHKGKNPYMLRN